MSNGEILVAESSIGHLKRYTSDGKFLGIVGTAKIGAGCKHVAVAKDVQHDWYFMMNTNSNSIAVLVPLSEAPAETDDEREARLAMQGLGQKLLGGWKLDKRTDKEMPKEEPSAIDPNEFDFGQHLVTTNKFLRLGADGSVSRLENKPVAQESKKKSSGGVLGALSQLFGGSSDETGMQSEEKLKWQAIKQEADVVQFAVYGSNGSEFAAAVRFIDDSKAEFKIYYDEVVGEPMPLPST